MADGTIRRQHRFTVLPEHLIRDTRVSDRAVRLWCLLDRYAGADGRAFPKRQTLAGNLDVSVATLDRAMNELVDHGWLAKQRREAGGVNDYTVLVAPAEEVPAGVLMDEDTPTDEDTPSSPASGGVGTGDAHKEASPKGDPDKDTRSARGMRLPEDWWPDDDLKQWFREQPFWDFISPQMETDKFRDYWHAQSGQRATKRDWGKTWKNWMRTAAERAGYRAPTGGSDDAVAHRRETVGAFGG